MSDRFRELEKPVDERRLDVVLMATVTSFEDLERPTRHDLRQFAELFTPLFRAAGIETKRTAAAALSRCATVPHEVILVIADEPVDICAPFLAHSLAIGEVEIAEIAARRGATHARSLARRSGLSARSAALLAETGDAAVIRSLTLRGLLPEDIVADDADILQRRRDDDLRRRLRGLVGAPPAGAADPAGAETPQLRPADAERLSRFAEEREPLYFATALADILGVRFQLAERIMLDISGADLARTLVALDFDRRTAAAALEAFFPHLSRPAATASRAEELLAGCDRALATERLASLIRSERRATEAVRHERHVVETARRTAHPASPVQATPPASRQARG